MRLTGDAAVTADGPLGPASAEELDAAGRRLERWLQEQVEENPVVVAVERDRSAGGRRWMARLEGEQKPFFAVWFDLRQRALHLETYFAPAPLERKAEFYEYLLRRTARLRGIAFAIGAEDAAYLVAELPVAWLDEDQLDRLLGSFWEATEQSFRPAMRIGYGERFTG